MQGKKIYQEKLFNDFRLSERVPEHNFYRQLQSVLDLNYLYALTKDFYGDSGQKSIDPVVFFKLCLVGYLPAGRQVWRTSPATASLWNIAGCAWISSTFWAMA